MNNPYPTARELSMERVAASILRNQAAAASDWFKAVAVLQGVFDRMDCPLGSPVEGYDLKHIQAILADLSIGVDDDEELAMDLARAGEPV